MIFGAMRPLLQAVIPLIHIMLQIMQVLSQEESTIITPTLANLNDFDVKMDDIENVYQTAPLTVKFWTILGH
jgi:hypothetical protein